MDCMETYTTVSLSTRRGSVEVECFLLASVCKNLHSRYENEDVVTYNNPISTTFRLRSSTVTRGHVSSIPQLERGALHPTITGYAVRYFATCGADKDVQRYKSAGTMDDIISDLTPNTS